MAALGDKLEAFYVSLRVASAALEVVKTGSNGLEGTNVHEVLYNVGGALFDLETHECLEERAETSAVLCEIVLDCRKKAAQVLRVLFAENVRVVISENRKRLASKAALVVDAAGSLNHSQRHVNVLIDLLGTWSNILMSVNALQLSGACLSLVVSPLHLRVIEMAMECFTQFKTDKKLDDWHRRIMAQVFASPTLSTESCNVVALDALLSVVSSMREVVSQYYNFLDTIQLMEIPTVGESLPAASTSTSASAPASAPGTLLGIVGRDEWNRWREVDAVYTSLEHGYLAHTIREALSRRELVEVEGRGVFVPRAVEDAFYLLHRIAERALLAGSESAALALGTRVVELLDPSSALAGGEDDAAVFLFVTDKTRFLGCYEQRRVGLGTTGAKAGPGAGGGAGGGAEDADDNSYGEPLPLTLPVLGNPAPSADPYSHSQQLPSTCSDHLPAHPPPPAQTKASMGIGMGLAQSVLSDRGASLQQQLSSAVGSEIAEELAVGAVVLADVAQGVNSWLSSFRGKRQDDQQAAEGGTSGASGGVGGDGMQAANTAAASSGLNGGGGGAAISSSANSRTAAAMSAALQEQAKLTSGGASSVDLLIAALETDALPSDETGGALSLDAVGREDAAGWRAIERCMALQDWGVYLSGLAVGPQCITRIQALYANPVHGAAMQSAGRLGLSIVESELSRVSALHASRLDDECRRLLCGLFERHLRARLSGAMAKGRGGYAIDGAEMERRSGDSDLVRAIHGFVGGGGGGVAPGVGGNGASGGGGGGGGGGSGGGGGVGGSAAGIVGGGGSGAGVSASGGVDSGGLLETSVKPFCSLAAYGALLVQLGKLISETFLATILSDCTFTEWGALLLHEEALGMVRVVEEAAEHTQRNTKDSFAPLVWALKLLSLNQLADIRHYTIPAIAAMDDETARALLRKRVDFSPDAVSKLKIKFSSDA